MNNAQPSVDSAESSSLSPRAFRDLDIFLPIFALAALVRAISWRFVMTPEGVVFRDSDGYSHMWRIWNAASKSIPLSARDPFVNFPNGGEVLWSPAFDWILATVIRWLRIDQSAAELLCAWVPLVLGSVAVALAAGIASRTFSRTAGWVTGVMLAVLPGSFLYTQLGYLDHHAAITLIGAAMLGGAMRIVSVGRSGPRFWPIVAGALCAFALLIWAGALLHVGVLQIAMLTWALGSSSLESAHARTIRLAAAHAITAIVILPFSLRVWEVFGDFSPLALTRFQPTWYGAGAICLAATTLLWRISRFGNTRPGRLLSGGALAVAGLGIAFIRIPQLAAILDESAGWFTNDVEFLSNITELTPLFSSVGQHPIWWQPFHYLSPLLFVFPFALIAVGWRTNRPERWLLIFWSTAFCFLTLSQNRFVNTFSVGYSIVWGGALALLLDWIGSRIIAPRTRFHARALVGIALATALVVPAWNYYAPRIRDEGDAVANFARRARIFIARTLATSRPPMLDEDGNPTEALLCVWTAGHEFRYYSGWAVNQDGFGPYVSPENTALSSRYYETTEEDEAIEILEQMGTRLVVADMLGAGQPPYQIDSMARRLVDSAGSGAEVDVEGSMRPRWIPALSRHRLIFAAPNGHGGTWLYEIVRGAIATGSATPGSRVTIELTLDTPSGHSRSWSTRQRVDKTGKFLLRLPYATIDTPKTGFTPLGHYRLRTARGVAEFDVTEAAVQEGATVQAPAIE
jgi:asparagine N-glycosylation enzyme membrane subunit Stt3